MSHDTRWPAASVELALLERLETLERRHAQLSDRVAKLEGERAKQRPFAAAMDRKLEVLAEHPAAALTRVVRCCEAPVLVSDDGSSMQHCLTCGWREL